MTSQFAILCSFLLLQAVLGAAAETRDVRRAPPTSDRPITLRELDFSCSVQGWTNCHNMTSSLLNDMHRLNVAIHSCISSNSPFAPTSPSEAPTLPLNFTDIGSWDRGQPEDSEVFTEVGSGSGGGGGKNSSSAGGAAGAAGEQQRCQVSGEDKKRIRREVYCELLFMMDEAVRTVADLMCWLRDFGCVDHYSDPGYLSPDQLLTSIRLWHQDMINTHKKCCESQNSTFSRDLEDVYGNKLNFRIGEFGFACPILNARLLWDHGLVKISLVVHMLELMQSLGRRKTCLRGCVSENQVFCCNLLPYLLL